jgi:glycosyltransferase involved in cell wall biosynthesis
LSGGRFKLIWHDHYGESENLVARKFKVLKKFSRYFAGIVSVNTGLKNWAINNLKCKNIVEIKNFIPEPDPSSEAKIKLKGAKEDFKIICVANLRPQKDHFNLLEAFEMLDPELKVSLHLIGEDPGTPYSSRIIKAIMESPVKHKIFYYGSQPEIIPLLKQADLGVLSSRSEGLPLALIEYGMAGLPVVCTDVGQCAEVLEGFGELVEKENPAALSRGILKTFLKAGEIKEESQPFSIKVREIYSEKVVIKTLIDFYNGFH